MAQNRQDLLIEAIREHNSHLQQLIDQISQLVARSRNVLRPEASAPSGTATNRTNLTRQGGRRPGQSRKCEGH